MTKLIGFVGVLIAATAISEITLASDAFTPSTDQYTNTQVMTKEAPLQALKSQNIPERLPRDLTQMGFTKLGEAKFSVLFWDVYNSHLYSRTGAYFTNKPQDLLFSITYLRDISANDLIENTQEQWRQLGFSPQQYLTYIPQLEAIWPDVQKGDNLTLLKINKQSVFYLNGKKIGLIADSQFQQMFLDIWLSVNTSEPKLRQQLLGVKS